MSTRGLNSCTRGVRTNDIVIRQPRRIRELPIWAYGAVSRGSVDRRRRSLFGGASYLLRHSHIFYSVPTDSFIPDPGLFMYDHQVLAYALALI